MKENKLCFSCSCSEFTKYIGQLSFLDKACRQRLYININFLFRWLVHHLYNIIISLFNLIKGEATNQLSFTELYISCHSPCMLYALCLSIPLPWINSPLYGSTSELIGARHVVMVTTFNWNQFTMKNLCLIIFPAYPTEQFQHS